MESFVMTRWQRPCLTILMLSLHATPAFQGFSSAWSSQQMPSSPADASFSHRPLIRLRGGSAADQYSFANLDAIPTAEEFADAAGGEQVDDVEEDDGRSLDRMMARKGRQPGSRQPRMTQEQEEQIQNQHKQEEAMRQQVLSRILSPEAKERLKIIGAANPDKARKMENGLIESARTGQILQQVSGPEMVKMLAAQGEKKAKMSEVKFMRRKTFLDQLGYSAEEAKRLGLNIDGWDKEVSEEEGSQYSSVEIEGDAADAAAAAAADADDDKGDGDAGNEASQ